MRQVTVFGGSGFIGRYIVQALAAEGAVVRVAVRRPQLAEFTRVYGDVGQVVPVQANLRYPASVDAAIAGSEDVVNVTGIFFQRGKQSYDAVHVGGARAIAEAARRLGVQRLVHVSGIGADDRNSPNRFVRSKALAEEAITAGFPAATILRPSVVFGPEDRFFNAIATAVRLAPVMPVFGSGEARLQPVYVVDVAQAAVRALRAPDAPFAVFELGGPQIYSYREVLQLTMAQMGRRRPLVRLPLALGKLGAFFAELLPAPPITRDQVDLLARDNIVRPGARTLADLGIAPTACAVVLPTYIDRFRIRGRYSQNAPA
jgi:uncharacterized protein YbjT (DUF2867 family)